MGEVKHPEGTEQQMRYASDLLGDTPLAHDLLDWADDYAALEARVRELEAEANGERFAHELTKRELAQATETWTDEGGTVWRPPTAWAYAQSCRVREDQRTRAEQAEAALSVAQKDAERLDWLHDNIPGDELYDAMYPHYRLRLASLREAIDAKMAENTVAHGGAGEGEKNG